MRVLPALASSLVFLAPTSTALADNCLADVNGDFVVDVDDLLQVVLDFGCTGPDCGADANQDGIVDVDDLVNVILEWSCIASSGVQLVASETAFLTNDSVTIRFQAQIPPIAGLDPDSVVLVPVDESMQVIGPPLCTPLDNGVVSNGDDIAGDGVYSCFVDFLEPEPVTIRVVAQADVGDQSVSSPPVVLLAVDPLTTEDATLVLDNQDQAESFWEANELALGDTLEARLQTVAQILELPGVAEAGVSSDDVTIWILYESGVYGGLMLNPPGTRGGRGADGRSVTGDRLSNAPTIPQEWETPPARFARPERHEGPHGAGGVAGADLELVGNNRVLIYAAYNSEFEPHDEAPDLQQLFQSLDCPQFEEPTYLVDGACTLAAVRSFTDYATIILSTHGAIQKDQVVFLTREQATVVKMVANSIDLVLGRLGVMSDVFAIRPGFISTLPGWFEDGLIFNSSCQSLANVTMFDAFTAKGARTYFGFDRTVNTTHAEDVANQLFNGLLQEQQTAEQAYWSVSPHTDPDSPNATLLVSGEIDLAYSGIFRNGSFEQGLEGWTVIGDGRAIFGLNEYLPPDGAQMALVSTGLGFSTSSGSIEQTFCLPVEATHLSFDWSYFSEEFMEYCGPQWPYDDPFEVVLETETGTTVLFSRTIDELCNFVSPTSLHFDQSGPGCVPTDGVDDGTGGNDCLVWGTGWQQASIDISGIAASNEGLGVTLRFRSFDGGDSVYDTAVIIDNVQIVEP